MIRGRSAWHFLRYLAGFDSPNTQTTAAEQQALSRFAAGKRRLVELGVFEGFTTRQLAEVMAPNGELYAVDPFLAGKRRISWGEPIARLELRSIRPPKQVHFVRAFSHIAAEMLQGEFDFIFFDGDHSLEGITTDWNDWSPRVSSGGIVALHDSIVPPHNPAVADLGSCHFFGSHIQHAAGFTVVEQIDSLSVLQRT